MSTRNDYFRERILHSSHVYNSMDVRQFLNEKGIVYLDHGQYLVMSCLFPDHGDSHPSFSINTVNYGYNCWGCNRTGTFRELADELGWKVQKIGTVLTGIVQPYDWADFRRNMSGHTVPQGDGSFPVPDGFTLLSDGVEKLGQGRRKCDRHWDYARQRGIVHLFGEFSMGYTTKRDMHKDGDGRSLYGTNYLDRILIPIHDIFGHFVWMEGRSILKKVDAKYWRPFGVQRNSHLFNIHRVIRKKFRWIILVEGVLTAAVLWSWGFPAVAVFGSAVSDGQLEMMMYFDTIYSCLDNDKAGREGYVRLKKMVEFAGVGFHHIIMPPKLDALDIGREAFEKKFSSARRIL